jgi:hypothetical protein
MGSEFIYERFSDGESEDNIRKSIRSLSENDRDEYGSRGYTGSWAEVPGVSFSSQIFEDEEAAAEYVSNHAQKWENALAVRFKMNKMKFRDEEHKQKIKDKYKVKIETDKKLKTLTAAREKNEEKFNAIAIKIRDLKISVNQAMLVDNKKEFTKCHLCKSSLNSKYVKKQNERIPEKENIAILKIESLNSTQELERFKLSAIALCPLCENALGSEANIVKLHKLLKALEPMVEKELEIRVQLQNRKEEIKEEVFSKVSQESYGYFVGAWASC